MPRTSPRTARIESIEDIYCGALFPLDRTDAFSKEVLPIFYGTDSRMLEYYTGQMLEIEGKIVEIPMPYRNIINKDEHFTFEKEKGLVVPFGLKVSNVEPYGLVDSFKVNAWLLGNLNPALYFKKPVTHGGQGCRVCGNFFSYMSIDPVEFPVRFGCFLYTPSRPNTPKDIRDSSEEFLELNKKPIPYIIFPEPFGLFEVFCPMVDILNDEQKEHSKDLLLGGVGQNLETLIRKISFLGGLKVPKESIVTVDFQYDQKNKTTQQTFNPANVPSWECSHYVLNPEWKKKFDKLSKRQREELLKGKQFKLRRGF